MINTNIDYLLTYCEDIPEIYNEVSTQLWIEFGIHSAEVSLLCTYMVNEWRQKDEHRTGNTETD